MKTLLILEKLISLVVGLLNAFDASKVVSDIIAKQIAEGREAWSPEERQAITKALDDAEAKADQQIRDAGG